MDIRRIKGSNPVDVARILRNRLKRNGYDSYAEPVGKSGVHLSDIRLSQKYVNRFGRNLSPFTGRRGNILGWNNWVHVNAVINKVFDELGASANISTLKGKFQVREGKKRFTRKDWEQFAGENVGSIVSPVAREDAWLPENPKKVREKLKKVI